MSHDGKRSGNGRNSCPKQGYIMSPSRGTSGETLWSTCSANVLRRLDMPCLEEGKINRNYQSFVLDMMHIYILDAYLCMIWLYI